MSNAEVLVYNIKNIDSATANHPILPCEYRPRQYSFGFSVDVEQGIHFALAEITQDLVWSQGHLVMPERLAASQNRKLNRITEHYPSFPILDAIGTIDNKMKGNETENPHIREAGFAFRKGVETANYVLEHEGFKTSGMLEGANLTLPEIEKIDKQVAVISGYYTAWEVLRKKRTTAEEFGANPFLRILELYRFGARNIDLETINPTTPIEANVFTRIGDTIQMVKWIQDKYQEV